MIDKRTRKWLANQMFLDDEFRNEHDLELMIAEDDFLEYGINPPFPIRSKEEQDKLVKKLREEAKDG